MTHTKSSTNRREQAGVTLLNPSSPQVYLVNPSERAILEQAGDRMPLGLLYIAKELERFNHPVKVYDMNHETEDKLVDDIVRENPHIVGISCLTTPMLNETKKLIQTIKRYADRIVVGGYHPTIMPEDFRGLADSVVIGEGEYGIECLVNDINGFKMNTRPVNLRALGKPARHLLDSNRYNLIQEGLRTSTMITSRGCPNKCVYCGNMNRLVRNHDLEDIEDELKEIKNSGYQAVYFLDDVFTINKNRAIGIGQLAKEAGLRFRITTRANYITSDLIRCLASQGLDIASMGVESGNSEVLNACGKGQTIGQIREAVALCGDYGVKTKGFFILGLPGETEKTAYQTIRFAEELSNLGMEYFDFYSLVPFPGTDIWKNPDKYGLKIIDTDYTHYLQATKGEPKIVCETKELKADKISELLIEAKRRLK